MAICAVQADAARRARKEGRGGEKREQGGGVSGTKRTEEWGDGVGQKGQRKGERGWEKRDRGGGRGGAGGGGGAGGRRGNSRIYRYGLKPQVVGESL